MGCYVTGNDAQTGKELWRNTLIPKKGEPGDETWGGMPFDQRWMTGVWGPITYDPDLNLAFYGSSGVGPASEAQRGVKGVATLAGTDTRYRRGSQDRKDRLETPGAARGQLGPGMHLRDDADHHAGASRSQGAKA